MRHTHIFLYTSMLLSGTMAAGYFVFGLGQDYVSRIAATAPATGLQTGIDPYAMAFNPQNEVGMIVILAAMIILAAIVIARGREFENGYFTQKK